MKIVQDHGFFI